MRLSTVAASLTLVAFTGAGLAFAQQPAPQPPAAPRLPGYLTPDRLPEASKFLPPPPVEGGAHQLHDLAVFRATRAQEGTRRWTLAQGDNDYTAPAMLQHFACSLGVSLDSQSAPRLTLLLRRMTVDAGASLNAAKQVFMRKRPYLYVEGDICIPKSQGLADSPDYPSGHTTLGWGTGLILAELAPDHSTAIMSRARAYGESRVVCGVHTPSAMEAGRSTGAAVIAALHGSAEFKTDLAAAAEEIAAARAAGKTPSPAACATEAETLAQAPF